MAKSIFIKFVLTLAFIPFGLSAQKLVYKLNSKVEVRNWKLNTKAYKEVTYLEGASIELFEGDKLLSKTTSDKDGNFEVNLPSTGNYTILISGAGYNTRKFSVKCNSIIIKNGESNFIPSVDLIGFCGLKEIASTGDLGLSHPTVQMADEKNEVLKYNGLNFPVNMVDGDVKMIQKFCTCNKLGEIAMQNKNYEMARTYFLMASNVFNKEEYPKEQIKRAEEGLKQQMFAEKDKMRSKSKAVATTKQVKTPINVTPQYNSNQKSGSGGHKVLPVLGGKK